MTSSLTFIDTNQLPRVKTPQGEVTEILNQQLVGAKNVLGTLRWLSPGEKFEAGPQEKHQLIYLMEGQGSIRLTTRITMSLAAQECIWDLPNRPPFKPEPDRRSSCSI